MDDFDIERALEDAWIDPFAFSLMDENERRETLENAHLDPDVYMDADLDPGFDAWEELQSAGLSFSELDNMDADERRAAIEDAGLDPDDYESLLEFSSASAPTPQKPITPQPETSSPKQEAQPQRNTYRYVSVRFYSGGQTYAYRTEDRSIAPGDRVMVPAGISNEPKLVTVVSVGDYSEETVPFPVEKTKSVLRKATSQDIESQRTTAPRSVSKPVDAVKSDQSEHKTPSEDSLRKKNRLLTVIVILLAVIAILLIGILSALHQQDDEKPASTPRPVSGSFSASTPKPASTPRPTPTATPRPTARPTSTPAPTPRPTATPRRNTNTPKPTTNSDPFNAQDYSHPEDFYYDYYDDFWDYEDAEDYWEEWND